MSVYRVAAALVAVVVVLLGAGAGFVFFVPMEFHATAPGRLEPGRMARVSFAMAGRVAMVARGNVKAGEAVAALDTAAEQAALASLMRQAELLRKEVELEGEALAAAGKEAALELAQAQKDVDRLRTRLELEKGRMAALAVEILKNDQEQKSLTEGLRRSEEAVLASLTRQGVAAQTEMELTKYRAALARLESASMKLLIERERMNQGLRARDLEVEASAAETRVAGLKGRPAGGRSVVALRRQLEELEVERARVERAAAEKRFVAPFDGWVMTRNVREGETLAAGQVALVLADEGPLVFRAVADQRLGVEIAVGQKGRVRLDVYPYLAHGAIPAEVTEMQTVMAAGEGASYLLTLRLGPSQRKLAPGLTGQADLVVFKGTTAGYLGSRGRR